MSLSFAVKAYLDEIQDEALERIYENAPHLRPFDNFPHWDGWKKILIRPADTIGVFTTFENWDSPELEEALGSLSGHQTKEKIEKATLLWINAEILALAEHIKSAKNINDMYAFSDSLSRRLQTLEYIDLKEVKDDLMREYLSSRGKKGAEAKAQKVNQVKELAWTAFFENYIRTNSFLSAKDLFNLAEELCKRDGIDILVELKTVSNWLPNFKRRAKSGK